MSAPGISCLIKETTLTEAQEEARGALIARVLRLKRSKAYSDRYDTDWGTKTDLGLFRIMARIVQDGE